MRPEERGESKNSGNRVRMFMCIGYLGAAGKRVEVRFAAKFRTASIARKHSSVIN
jgi:hypothetical protein